MFGNSIRRLRIVGFAEGTSLLVLMFIAMPLKYFAGKPEVVKITGWIHGFLFILFMLMFLNVFLQKKWPFKKLVFAFLAAFLPFGTFVFDAQLKKEQNFAETN